MSIRTLSIDFAFYGLLDLLQRSVGLLMIPLYTRVLRQQEYGDFDIILIASTVVLVLVDLQFVSGFSRLYLEHHRAGDGRRFVGTVLAARLIGGIVLPGALIAVGWAGHLEFSFIPSFKGNAATWSLALAAVPLSLTYDILLLQARMLRWKVSFAAGAFSNTVVSSVLSVLFAVTWHWGIYGVVLGLVLGKAAGLLSLLWTLRDEVTLCFDAAILKRVGLYTLPLIPGWWVAFGSSYLGRFFVYGVNGADQNAILAVCMKIAGVIGLYSVSFRSAWHPLAMAYIGDAAGEQFYVRSMRLFISGGLFSIFCLALVLHAVLPVLAPVEYAPVEYYFPLFAVGALIAECESNLQLGNQIAKRTHWISISSVVYVAVNAAILMLFTQSLGVVAAGLGLAVSALAKGAVTYASGQKNWRIPYDIRSFVLLGVGCCLLLLFGLGLQVQFVSAWAIRLCMALAGVAVPWFMLAPVERASIKVLASKRLVMPLHKA